MKEIEAFTFSGGGRKAIYPWDKWKNGKIWEVTLDDIRALGSKVQDMGGFVVTIHGHHDPSGSFTVRRNGDTVQFQFVVRNK